MKFLVITILSLSALPSFGATGPCKEIKACVEMVSKLTNKKYVLDKDVKGSIDFTDNYQITKDNADAFISYALYMAGYTRIPFNKDEWAVLNARDVRYQPVPSFNYPEEKVPETYDYISVSIKLKNPHIASELSRNFRPFMSRYGRIIDLKSPGMLIINDTGKNIHRLIKIVSSLDHKPTKEELEKIEEDQKRWQKLELIKSKNCSHVNEELKEVKNLLVELKNRK